MKKEDGDRIEYCTIILKYIQRDLDLDAALND